MNYKHSYTAEEVANIIIEDIPTGDSSSLEDDSFDSDNEEDLILEDRIQAEQLVTQPNVSISEYYSSSSESDIDVGNDDDDDDDLVVATQDTVSSKESDDGNVDLPSQDDAASNSNLPVLDGDNYDIQQDRKWKKKEKIKFSPNFDQPEGALSICLYIFTIIAEYILC